MTRQKNKGEGLELHLKYLFDHGVDFEGRNITLDGDVEEGWFQFVDCAMNEMERRSRQTVTLRINSYGGEVYEALAVIGRLDASKCKIVTEGYGKIMSAATLILASGDERKASKYSFFMHHGVSYDVGGSHAQVKTLVNHFEKMEKQWALWMAEFTHKSEKFWLETGMHTDQYWGASELLELGVIDAII